MEECLLIQKSKFKLQDYNKNNQINVYINVIMYIYLRFLPEFVAQDLIAIMVSWAVDIYFGDG